jgi:hypothetical protein
MKAWNKETRNEFGKFYRTFGDWGIELGQIKDNFTTVKPPDETINNKIACDWDEENNEWVLDQAELSEKSQIENRFASLINEINTKYENLNISTEDNTKTAGIKMIKAGVSWNDVDIYGGRLKMLLDIMNT